MAAQKYRHEPLTALAHHMDLNWMGEAYRCVRKDAAPGVDGQTVAEYGESLVENLRDLQERAKSGSYRAPPVKRGYVPKNEKEDRPIGLPTTEDKILQKSVSMILEPIYEQEFLPFSFGFRPGRSQHQALDYLREECFKQKVQWVLEVDLAKFFDTVDHRQMRELLSRRVQDGVISRLIAKWLKAGVWEKGNVSYPDEGTPQGGVNALQVAQPPQPTSFDDMGAVSAPSAGMGPATRTGGGASAESRIAPSHETCMMESENKPRTSVALNARSPRSPVR